MPASVDTGTSVIPRAQTVDDRGQGRHRLAAVAAAIVQQHDLLRFLGAVRANLSERRTHEGRHAGALPVVRIDMEPDIEIATLLRVQRWDQFVRGGWLGIAEIGRTKEAHRVPGIGLDQPPGGVEPELDAGVRNMGHIGVGITVVAQFAGACEYRIEQAGPVAAAPYDERCWQMQEMLVSDQAALIAGDPAPSGARGSQVPRLRRSAATCAATGRACERSPSG